MEDLAFIGTDILVVLGVVFAALVYVYTIGRGRAVSLLLGAYLGVMTFMFLPALQGVHFSFFEAPEYVHELPRDGKVASLLLREVVFCYLLLL